MSGLEPDSWEPRGEAPKSEENPAATENQSLHKTNGAGLRQKHGKLKIKNKGGRQNEK